MPKALTQIAVEKIQPGAQRQEIPDGLVTGLYLVVQPSGKRNWAVRYRNEGKPRKLTLGMMSLADARKQARDILTRVALGSDPATERVAERKRSTDTERSFEVAVRRYIIEYQIGKKLQGRGEDGPRNRTWREPARQLGLVPPLSDKKSEDVSTFVVVPKSLVDRWGKRSMDSITTEELIAELDDQAPIQANRFLNTLRTLWKFARSPRVKLTSGDPLAGVSRQTRESSRDRVLADDELRRIWWAADHLGQPWTALLRTLIMTGQRRDEVAKLPWSELDISGRKWTIPSARAKNGDAQLVHVTPAVLAEIAGLPRDRDFVFSRGQVAVADFSDAKAKIDALANVTGWTFHDLRRTMATRLSEMGTPTNVTEALLNHRSGSKAGVAGTYDRSKLEPQCYRASHGWARYVAFVVDERLYDLLQARLEAAEDTYDVKLGFYDAIRAGGGAWATFLQELEGGNVHALRVHG